MPLGGLLTAGLITAGVGAAAGIGKGISDISRAKKIKPAEYKPYEISQSARRMQGLAQAQLNARNPFAAAQQRGILASQAGSMAGVQRSATSSSQALAAAAGLQAGTNQALYQQGLQEQQAYQNRLATLFGAERTMMGEEQAKWNMDERKRMQDVQLKEQMRSAGWQSVVGGLQNAAGMMIAGSQYGSKTPIEVLEAKIFEGMQTVFRRPISPRSSQVNPNYGFQAIERTRKQ
jgi:hypothetical protein